MIAECENCGLPTGRAIGCCPMPAPWHYGETDSDQLACEIRAKERALADVARLRTQLADARAVIENLRTGALTYWRDGNLCHLRHVVRAMVVQKNTGLWDAVTTTAPVVRVARNCATEAEARAAAEKACGVAVRDGTTRARREP